MGAAAEGNGHEEDEDDLGDLDDIDLGGGSFREKALDQLRPPKPTALAPAAKPSPGLAAPPAASQVRPPKALPSFRAAASKAGSATGGTPGDKGDKELVDMDTEEDGDRVGVACDVDRVCVVS